MLTTKRSPEQSEYIAISKVRWALFVLQITVLNNLLSKRKKKRERKKHVDVSLNIMLTSITLYVNGSS